jgi:hypothetical protein
VRRSFRPAAILTVLALLPAARPAAGQGWVADLSAGSAEYEGVAGALGSRSAMAAVRYDGPRWLYLSAGAPLDSAGIPWAAAGAGGRASVPLHSLEAGVDLGAHGFGYRQDELEATGWGLTLVGLPYLAFTPGAARLELRSGLLHHASSFGDTTTSRTVLDSGLRGWLSLSSGVQLGAEARLVRGEEGSYPFAGASAEVPLGPGAVWVRAGRWMADELDDGVWSAGVRLRLPARTTLRAEYREDGDDPLYWNGSRRGWTVGLSRSFGARPLAGRPLAAPVAVRPVAGAVTVRLPVRDSRQAPSLAGDFNGWRPAPMRRAGDFWEARLSLAPGVYHYSFVRPDGSWFVPESVPNRGDDGFGGVNAVLVVTGS